MTVHLREDIRRHWGDDEAGVFARVEALEGPVYREEAGRRTLRFELGGARYFLKHHKGVGWREIVKNLLQLRWPVTSARVEWEAIGRLRKLGVATLSAAAFGERGRSPARRESFLITDALRRPVSLETCCARWAVQPPSPRLRRHLLDSLAGISRRLHGAGVFHRDYYLCHFLLEDEGGHDGSLPRPVLIDLHRVLIAPRRRRRWAVKDLAALYFSARGMGLSERDRLRFLRRYSGSLRGALERDAGFWQAVARRARRMARREERRWLARWRHSELQQSLSVPAAMIHRLWDRLGESEREAFLQALVKAIAEAHRHGILPSENGIRNVFDGAPGDPPTLGGGPAAPPETTLAARSRAINLAAWLAWLPAEVDDRLGRLQQCYASHYGDRGTDHWLDREVRRRREERWAHWYRRLYRNTSRHRRIQHWSRVTLQERAVDGPQMQQFLRDPDRFLQQGRMLKDGDSTTVVAIDLDGCRYVVKRYNRRNWGYAMRRLLRPSRAWRCWAAGYMLTVLGLRTPRPVAMREDRWGPLRRRAWLLTEAVEGDDALQVLSRAPMDSPQWQYALEGFRAFFRVLRRHRVVHGDLKATNFITRAGAPVVIDLDATRKMRPGRRFERAFRRDLQRFLKNWRDCPQAHAEILRLAKQFSTGVT